MNYIDFDKSFMLKLINKKQMFDQVDYVIFKCSEFNELIKVVSNRYVKDSIELPCEVITQEIYNKENILLLTIEHNLIGEGNILFKLTKVLDDRLYP